MTTPRKSPRLMKYNINVNSPIVCSTPNFQLIAFTPSPISEFEIGNPCGSEVVYLRSMKQKRKREIRWCEIKHCYTQI